MQEGLSGLSLDLIKSSDISSSMTSLPSEIAMPSLAQSSNEVTKKYFSKFISASLMARFPPMFLNILFIKIPIIH